MSAGIKAFRESWMSTGDLETGATDFSSWDARRLRYSVLWAAYENTVYRDIHLWSKRHRADYGLYKYVRSIHSPAYRLGEFYATHLMGGALDLRRVHGGKQEAGDGGACPIVTDSPRLRLSIAALWRSSNWQVNKEIWTRQGSILGDIGLQVVDDATRGKVYLKVLHPGILKSVTKDPWGNVKSYCIEEQRADPTRQEKTVTYTETAMRDGDDVVYQTYRNGSPYAWNGISAEWTEPYGFIPLVLVQHLNVGLDWGWSELHAGQSKFREADDLASKLSDQIRKTVDSPWLLAGVKRPEASPTIAGAAASTTKPEPGREEVPILYASDPQAKPHPMVAPLNIPGVSARIDRILEEIERDYPELQMDIWTASGDASGRALRVARQRVTSKTQMRRAGYDDALMRAQQMAIAIGGHRGYAGYESFSLDSYAAGQLDHTIGERPVFETDPLDTIEEDVAFWGAAAAAQTAGYDLELFLRDKGWSEEKIAKVLAAKAARQQQAATIAAPAVGDKEPE